MRYAYFGTVSGGAELTGGNFWQGAATGLVVSTFNHAMHDLGDPQETTSETVSGESKYVVVGEEKFKPFLINESKIRIYYKPEDPCTSQPLDPGQITYELIDGVNGKVYKVTDGYMSVRVTENLNVIADYRQSGFFNFCVFVSTGGWLTKKPDECWTEIFNAHKI